MKLKSIHAIDRDHPTPRPCAPSSTTSPTASPSSTASSRRSTSRRGRTRSYSERSSDSACSSCSGGCLDERRDPLLYPVIMRNMNIEIFLLGQVNYTSIKYYKISKCYGQIIHLIREMLSLLKLPTSNINEKTGLCVIRSDDTCAI